MNGGGGGRIGKDDEEEGWAAAVSFFCKPYQTFVSFLGGRSKKTYQRVRKTKKLISND
jgi:hypothetical protein